MSLNYLFKGKLRIEKNIQLKAIHGNKDKSKNLRGNAKINDGMK